MEEDLSTAPDSPSVESADLSREQSAMEKQRAALQTYLSSLPYDAESEEDMQSRLEFILGRIIICAEAKNWLVLATWDGVLQCWLLMRYPVPVQIRAKLVRLYYELCILPGIEPRLIRNWADMLSRLLAGKLDTHRKLEPEDLQLPWRPLWRVLQKEIWPKTRFQDQSRNVVNIFLYVAERSRYYYFASDIPEMLETFIPLITQETYLTIMPVMTSFLPPTHIHLYLPTIFKIWEAFNSSLLDDRLIEVMGELSEEHVSGSAGKFGVEGGAQWKDVGIWSETEWTVLMGKALGSMNVPVGATRGASTTGAYADTKSGPSSLRIRKTINRFSALAKIVVYSTSVDGPVRPESSPSRGEGRFPSRPVAYLAGSKAMESLEKFITSTESFFHPSNSGLWSLSLTQFLRFLTSEFCKRWREEELPSCKTPLTHRLTPAIRRAFVLTLRTPALLAMFSKDPVSMGLAQSALRSLAFLEPALVMPDLLERAYSGLEVVNETHRTTAVLSMLGSVSLPLSSETIWLGGQKHILPLLEMCIPGIDLNDPAKTIFATMFIIAVVQNIKIGDLSSTQSRLSFSSDAPGESMDVDDRLRLPDGTEHGASPSLTKAEERTLVRESTAGFADWVTSLFRRVLSLYENLPEEGGKKNTTGGKQEESVVKSIKSMLDLICLHLSDPLFDLVLKLVYEYATTNAKSNAVKAIGQLISSLALAHPAKTIDKFLPFCLSQVKDELKHGASSVRTTSSHAAIPSDTTLHWNISILRGCFGHDGTALLKHKADIMELLSLLVDKTFSERGYSSTGRLIHRVLNTLVGVYPLNARFVNTDEWNSEGFDRDHNSHWGRLHKAEDVKIEWHVPSNEEISFALEILSHIVNPALDEVEALLSTSSSWDGVARNDFCRYLHIARSAWQGLPMFCKEPPKVVAETGLNLNSEVECLVVQSIDVQAGFTLTDPADPRHQMAYSQRLRLGRVVHEAALALKQEHKGEDHIDAVMSVVKSIDTYLLDYALSRGDFDNLQKSYSTARELNRAWPRQKENSRLVHLKRALVYHSGRVYMHALYRRRSELDNHLIKDLLDLSLSPYTRVRRHAQAVLGNTCGYYVRSTKLILPSVFDALVKGSDPDRMKGALYILWSKGISVYAIADPKDPDLYGRYLLALLECQHQEKPSIQKLITSVANDAITNLAEETTRTDAYTESAPQVKMAVDALRTELSPDVIDNDALSEALHKSAARVEAREKKYNQTILAITEIALRPTTHWRYTHLALQFLSGLLRRDVVPPSDVARLFISHTLSPHPPLRGIAQKGIIKLLSMVKMRTYSRTSTELWLGEWKSPITKHVSIKSDSGFHVYINKVPSIKDEACYIDKQYSGFLAWAPESKAYMHIPAGDPPITWESASKAVLEAIGDVAQAEYFEKLLVLWSQESSRNVTAPELRTDNVAFIKTIAKMSQGAGFENILIYAEKLLWDVDRFKQRAGAEVLAGVTRGAKNWPKQRSDQLWYWVISRLDRIYTSIKPDTIGFWEATINALLEGRDPRRVPALSEWILSLPLDFHGDSAFAMIKTLTILGCFLDNVGYRDVPLLDRYFALLLEGTDVSFAETRVSISTNLYMIATRRWRPSYPSVDSFLRCVASSDDPLSIRRVPYLLHVSELANKLSDWKEKRHPPPRVNQSEYDKVGLSLLRWIWISFYSPQAPLMFPYVLPLLPEIFRMSELSDDPELQSHSQAVLYILSAVSPPLESVEAIGVSFVSAISSSTSWRIRLNSLPTLVVFFYRNLMGISNSSVSKIMDLLLNCLSDDNVEVREMASSALSGIVRVSQRQSIIPLKDHFVSLARGVRLPTRRDPGYPDSMRTLHSAILGLCALIESFPYSVEKWMPPLTDILALHATDPPPISTTIRKTASEFKKTHQDTWHRDQLAFDEDQLQNLSTMLVGTSYYA
ncbi:hypothetical protein F5148DRAFT_1212253 [Russula earlei]|uniref:Uncharacterized protein n=1 Tax=Russula earlei TaxID=71964 RepID=A0ACC0U4F6_9AGAM|nr:hypothetical protein F5148DRAFT_1212253 [Russula earlei]